MRTKSVLSGWLQRDGRRLDCGPYMSGALEARIRLERLTARKDHLRDVTLNGMAGIFNGPRFARAYVDDPTFGVPFLGSTDILNADLTTLPLLSRRQVKANPRLVVRAGWTLITCSGTTGRMAFARGDMDGMAGSQHFMRVVPDLKKIPPGYLYAYLSSKFGVPLVVGGTYGAIIQHIEPAHIADLPVPRFRQNLEHEVSEQIVKAADLSARAAHLYGEATSVALSLAFVEDVPPAKWHATAQTSFTAHLDSYRRLRALSYDPRAISIIGQLKKRRHLRLSSILGRPPFRPNRFNRIDVEPGRGVQLIGQREMFQLRWEGRWIAKTTMGDPTEALPPTGTIALACIGTLGEQEVYCRAIRVRDGQQRFALSDNVLQIRVDNERMPSGYVFALLRSDAYFRVLRSLSIGGKQQVLHPVHVGEIPIPLISDRAMVDIDERVREADQLLDAAARLEASAISRVEAEIDKGAN